MSGKRFYITTAIDYTNGPPHIGHAYEKLLADVIARYRRQAGEEVYFLTGVDQHGQKVQQSAQKEGITPQEFADANTAKFIALWRDLGVVYDGWAATTHPHHRQVVQHILNRLNDAGQLYKSTHQGFYSIRQEQFLTDKDRNEEGEFGPEWGEVQELAEDNWYFRLSDHLPWLKEFVENREDFIYPEFRRRELINALENSEGVDLCISRPKNRLEWGIEIPFDPDFVTYVWFDALINYISFAGYERAAIADPDSSIPDFDQLWPADVHLLGKDIMVPAHAVYWPCMLKGMGFRDEEMPRLVVHGFWNDKRGEKFSKSEGNVIDPRTRMERFGVDGLRYYLMKSIATGRDADFNDDLIVETFNRDLANDLGNLVNRTLKMPALYRDGVITANADYDDDLNAEVRSTCAQLTEAVAGHMRNFQVHLALEEIWKLVTVCNQYVDRCQPWVLSKDETQATRLDSVLYHLAEALVHIAVHVAPVLPSTSQSILEVVGFKHEGPVPFAALSWGMLKDGHVLGEKKALFPRIKAEKA